MFLTLSVRPHPDSFFHVVHNALFLSLSIFLSPPPDQIIAIMDNNNNVGDNATNETDSVMTAIIVIYGRGPAAG